MKPCIAVVECAIRSQDKFLIIKRPPGGHAQGLLALPAGKLELQDHQEDQDIFKRGALREVEEEVGLLLQDPLHYVTSSYFTDDFGKSVIMAVFYCELDKTICDVKPSLREVPEHYWMTVDEIMAAENSPPWLKRTINQTLAVIKEHK